MKETRRKIVFFIRISIISKVKKITSSFHQFSLERANKFERQLILTRGLKSKLKLALAKNCIHKLGLKPIISKLQLSWQLK